MWSEVIAAQQGFPAIQTAYFCRKNARQTRGQAHKALFPHATARRTATNEDISLLAEYLSNAPETVSDGIIQTHFLNSIFLKRKKTERYLDEFLPERKKII
jgi:hypothetical protein